MIALIVPAAGTVILIIEAIQAAWGAIEQILQAFDRFIAFLLAVRGGNAGPQLASAIASAGVAVVDFVSNWLLEKLGKAAKKVAAKLKRMARKFARKFKGKDKRRSRDRYRERQSDRDLDERNSDKDRPRDEDYDEINLDKDRETDRDYDERDLDKELEDLASNELNQSSRQRRLSNKDNKFDDDKDLNDYSDNRRSRKDDEDKDRDKEESLAEKERKLTAAVDAAVAAVNTRYGGQEVSQAQLILLLQPIKLRYQLVHLRTITEGNKWSVEGEINPKKKKKTNAINIEPEYETAKSAMMDRDETDLDRRMYRYGEEERVESDEEYRERLGKMRDELNEIPENADLNEIENRIAQIEEIEPKILELARRIEKSRKDLEPERREDRDPFFKVHWKERKEKVESGHVQIKHPSEMSEEDLKALKGNYAGKKDSKSKNIVKTIDYELDKIEAQKKINQRRKDYNDKRGKTDVEIIQEGIEEALEKSSDPNKKESSHIWCGSKEQAQRLFHVLEEMVEQSKRNPASKIHERPTEDLLDMNFRGAERHHTGTGGPRNIHFNAELKYKSKQINMHIYFPESK